ncbi:hypothetical protein ACFQZR_17050 [Paenibacillus sp. GCM10027629]|uniref:hypothetical protein n=1 Tax=Paenibacillus sp. GCM10027629 TaxID=3273414 RepID=UPI0036411454
MNAGLIMAACVLIGGAIGYFTGHVEVWGGLGVVVGLLGMAYIQMNKKSKKKMTRCDTQHGLVRQQLWCCLCRQPGRKLIQFI